MVLGELYLPLFFEGRLEKYRWQKKKERYWKTAGVKKKHSRL